MRARLTPDNYHISELIDVSVAAVLIDQNHASIPMVIGPRDVVIFTAMTACVRSPTSQHECSDYQGDG